MKTRTATTVSLTDKRQTPWQNLRQLLLCLLILLPGILTAQTIEKSDIQGPQRKYPQHYPD